MVKDSEMLRSKIVLILKGFQQALTTIDQLSS